MRFSFQLCAHASHKKKVPFKNEGTNCMILETTFLYNKSFNIKAF
mgnify:CR=1 FL=1